MNTEKFDNIVEFRIQQIKTILLEKSKEYAKNDDRLHNFNQAAKFGDITRERALWGFAMKHYVSFMDILNDLDNGKLPSEDLLNEKIGDLINYLILCEISIKDKIQSNI